MSKSGERILRGARQAVEYARSGRGTASYDALVAPDPQSWLALPEDERTRLVEDYHLRIRAPLSRARRAAHALFHIIVENNIASGEEPLVKQTLDRLLQHGLDRHDAIHAIASIFADMVYAAARENAGFSREKLQMALRQLTAETWLNTDWDPG